MAVIGWIGLSWAFVIPFFLGMDFEDSIAPNNYSIHLTGKILKRTNVNVNENVWYIWM